MHTIARSSKVFGNYGIYKHNWFPNAVPNGKSILDIVLSFTIEANQVIVEFYMPRSVLSINEHGFVVVRTEGEVSYMCHLTADQNQLKITLEKIDWKLTQDMETSNCRVPTERLKDFLHQYSGTMYWMLEIVATSQMPLLISYGYRKQIIK